MGSRVPNRPGPGPHPEPPANLHSLDLPLKTIDHGSGLWPRLYSASYPSSLHFGTGRRHRFDDPEGEYGVLYAGEDVACAFIETFGDSHSAKGSIELAAAELVNRHLALIEIQRPLRVIDLTAEGAMNIGAEGRLSTVDDYALSQRWSRALWSHPAGPDGIYYVSRHNLGRRSLALFDRAGAALHEALRGSLLLRRNASFLAYILRNYRVSLLP